MRAWVVALMLLVASGACAAPGGAAADSDPDVALLAERGITPDAAGLRTFFESLCPSPERAQRISGQIANLGHDDYLVREAAMRDLLAMPVLPMAELRQAAAGDDLETRWRAEKILHDAASAGTTAGTFQAAFNTISKRKIKGLAGSIVDVMPMLDQEYLRTSGRRALAETVDATDAELLRRVAAGASGELADARVSAIAVLPLADPARANDLLLKLLIDHDERVRLAAATTLGDSGEHAALPVLADLLDADTPLVRARAYRAIRGLTGQSILFNAYDAPDVRKLAVDAWQKWVHDHGATAKLTYPVSPAAPMLGRTLISFYSTGKVLELDAAGRTTLETGLSSPFACQGLPNGHRLVVEYSPASIVEYDEKGTVVNRIKTSSSPSGVWRLENGNTLAACGQSDQKVFEYKPDGKVARELAIPGVPTDIKPLDGDRFLVTLMGAGKVVEVDGAGKVLHETRTGSTPYSAQPLDSGNILVAENNAGRIVEYDPTGREVWRFDHAPLVYAAQRTAEGNTVFGDSNGVHEINAAGRSVWEAPINATRPNQIVYISRY